MGFVLYVHKRGQSSERLDSFTVVDVRSSYEYRTEHIKGAISAPLRFLKEHIENGIIPLDKPLVFYCGCPHHLSTMAAKIAEGMGIGDVYVLDEGFFVWRDRGYPTEGERKGKEPNYFYVKGFVRVDGLPLKYARIFFVEKKNGQVEMEITDGRGYYEGRLPFYDIQPGDTVLLYIGTSSDYKIFTLPPKRGEKWGAVINVEDNSLRVDPL